MPCFSFELKHASGVLWTAVLSDCVMPCHAVLQVSCHQGATGMLQHNRNAKGFETVEARVMMLPAVLMMLS